ncbi:hypothetical protein ATPR_3247 [Acetobacter tropicalis NBRC 101654]|uniref:Uncharacterized protein n=1 Tax=Acetobacter tropicalis NBRC 101654 TaxID=749388 RepID=F7VIP8_9PROT|nr:hypothetical protein ATPR_3247 [Acetobacter tropicalis NBRC 101654]
MGCGAPQEKLSVFLFLSAFAHRFHSNFALAGKYIFCE